MSIDMSQFHAVFFEESFEGLDVMETGLLELSPGVADAEVINNIFRAAHSIKGGSGTFGFKSIADFTHVMETLLDQIRDGEREVTADITTCLLESVDCLRELLEATRDGSEIDVDNVARLQSQLEQMLTGETVTSATVAGQDSTSQEQDAGSGIWQIKFHPHESLYQTGNDPVRIFRELENLGEMEIEAVIDELPPFKDINAEHSYISWNIRLITEASHEAINDVFAWVEDDCELQIEQLVSEASDTSDSSAHETEASSKEQTTETANSNRKAKKSGSENATLRVSTDKVDDIINLVGELVITQSMLSQCGEEFALEKLEKLKEGLGQLERNTRELQESVMQIRMLPISFSFNRFPRLVHDLSGKLNKKIELKLSGESTELDKTVLEKIGDPMVHLVRNSLDHGIESPDVRLEKGKPETGILHLNAYHEGGNIVIEITDDGAGLNTEKILNKARERGLVSDVEADSMSDEQIHQLIFKPGFSTADVVSDVSGRGVGMDVVRRNIKDLGGVVEVRSEQDKGSVFTIRLPLTLAILDGQLVKVSDQTYIIPLVSIVESLQINMDSIQSVVGQAEVYKLRDEYIPIVRLYQLFNLKGAIENLEDGLLVVVEAEGRKIGIFIDDLLAQQQVVIKSLETNYQKVEGISGATILGDGQVALILDMAGLNGLYQAGIESITRIKVA